LKSLEETWGDMLIFESPLLVSTIPTLRRGRALGLDAASFEVSDRPLQEDFLTGIGFAYALALLARVARFATWIIKFGRR